MLGVQVRDVGDTALVELPRPECGAEGYLLRILACAVCGTDVKIMRQGHRLVKYPVVPGHELVGEIEAVGERTRQRGYPFAAGDRIVMSPGMPCGRCQSCLDGHFHACTSKSGIGFHVPGGFSEYLSLPERAIYSFIKVPESLDSVQATLMEPLACCLHGQYKVPLGPADTVVIIGAGAIGALHAELARVRGAARIIMADVASEKLELVRRLNEQIVAVNSRLEEPEHVVMRETHGEGAELVIIACPSAAVYESALRMCRSGGTVLFFSGFPGQTERLALDVNAVHYRELKILGAFGSVKREQLTSLELLRCQSVRTRRIITHVVELAHFEEALRIIDDGRALKLVLTM
jgi:L-iditol 2-dehydrogenase